LHYGLENKTRPGDDAQGNEGDRRMPNLYCAVHGRGHENRIIAEQAAYQEASESVLVISGKLSRGPWQCDKCNATLRKGDQATLLSSFPSQVTESMHDYEFAAERRYFAMRGEEAVTVYGAPWPCGDVAAMVRRAR
jgi:ribosomal protein L37AE/L43A